MLKFARALTSTLIVYQLQHANCQARSQASSSLIENEESFRWHKSIKDESNATVFARRQSRRLQFEGMFENVQAKGERSSCKEILRLYNIMSSKSQK